MHLAMQSFGEFLVGMGIRKRRSAISGPANGPTAPTTTARGSAGLVAWNYEHDGVRPMLIGHSQGGCMR